MSLQPRMPDTMTAPIESPLLANRWDDAQFKALREELVADLYDALPSERRVLEVERPA